MRRCCSDALVYSNKTGAMYFGHPGESIPGPDAGTRANYTILRSLDEGASCKTDRIRCSRAPPALRTSDSTDPALNSPSGHFLEVVFPAGSGYSDMHLLPSSEAGDLIGVAFQKCDDVHQRQTSGMSMGWALVRVRPPSTSTPRSSSE